MQVLFKCFRRKVRRDLFLAISRALRRFVGCKLNVLPGREYLSPAKIINESGARLAATARKLARDSLLTLLFVVSVSDLCRLFGGPSPLNAILKQTSTRELNLPLLRDALNCQFFRERLPTARHASRYAAWRHLCAASKASRETCNSNAHIQKYRINKI